MGNCYGKNGFICGEILMKIALCQVNPTLGAFQDNQKMIMSNYKSALEKGAELVVFPELVITGYPPQDLIWEEAFISQNNSILEMIASQSTTPLILGFIREENGNYYNSAALCQGGKVTHTYDKILLPTYDVFDEDRYFTPGADVGIWPLELKGKTIQIGIQICEDLWDEDYDYKVSLEQKKGGADCIINISASPFHEGRLAERIDLIQSKIKNIQLPFYYCNLVGAQDELIFDGQSLAFNHRGENISLGNAFSPDILIIDSKQQPKPMSVCQREENMYNALVLGVKDYFTKTGHSEAVIGLSGGIDSALVACIAADALGPGKVHGISLPSKYSSDHSLADAEQLARNLNIDYRILPIAKPVQILETSLAPLFMGKEPNVAEENIQARIRGNLLMALSNKFGWLVLSTGNKTEIALGYCTLYGDMSGGLSVISDLSKVDVYALARYVNQQSPNRIPENTITKPPSAELAPNQVDPFDYDIVSPLVDKIVEDRKSIAHLIEDGANSELVRRIYRLISINEYKRRQAAPGLRVSPKAFGIGRRVPIVNHFNGEKSHE